MSTSNTAGQKIFLLTPLREGRLCTVFGPIRGKHFYSRPCGRGDQGQPQ